MLPYRPARLQARGAQRLIERRTRVRHDHAPADLASGSEVPEGFRGVLGAPRLDGDGAILPACASQPLPQIPDGADVGALGLDAHEHLLAHWLGGRKVADLSRLAPSDDLHDAHRRFLVGPST